MGKLKNLTISIINVTAMAREAGRNPIVALPEYAYLRRIRHFTEHNIRQYKLLSPSISYARKREFIPSDSEVLKNLWDTLNPEEREIETEDKSRLYRTAAAAGLPVPRSYALLSPDWAMDWLGNDLGTRNGALDYLRKQRPTSLVIKPAQGTQARMTYLGARCIDEETLVYADPFGEEFSVATVLDHCLDRDAFAAEFRTTQRIPTEHVFIAQEYVEQTRAWARWFGVKLAPLRLITLLDDNDVKIIAGYVHIYGSALRSDEKMLAPIDVKTGEIGAAVRWKRGDMTPMERIDYDHDVFEGVECLQWRELQQIARKAARAFPQTRAVGWDFVMTDEGPVILEGNTRWGVHSVQSAYRRGLMHGSLKLAVKDARRKRNA